MRGRKSQTFHFQEKKVASKEESCDPAGHPVSDAASHRGLKSAALEVRSFSRPPPSLVAYAVVRRDGAGQVTWRESLHGRRANMLGRPRPGSDSLRGGRFPHASL